eukprot:CAMPEP_0194757082 /NCGR_PEP_ID=MMETSP0323_2-20130528/10666_1 /TAXON_ID=2866 ORGANISM="Crypthecodinium cohnii, Strain Seligo" /NCGR_SAMPLE_ID=MMETSP0323_2 /ASSEMBLY_ACC=CAM_ASM_000346 /LENGTH=204 /DNA_ID=CAMNT_0039676887 /DNA_START=51 /DNA_END=662 /DNA_ORIENTATION=+
MAGLGGYSSPQLPGPGGEGTPSGPSGAMEGGHGTLDEPVTETIMRDLRSIGTKLKYVMLPRARADKAHGLKQWDLWGPLFLCLALGIMLSLQTGNSTQAGLAFALVFVIVWIGSGVVTLNAVLLGGQISFFQSVCVLGYCIFPLVIAAFLSLMLQIIWLKVIFVVVGFTWSTGASVGFMSELVPDDRKALGVYPVWLFYVAIAW